MLRTKPTRNTVTSQEEVHAVSPSRLICAVCALTLSLMRQRLVPCGLGPAPLGYYLEPGSGSWAPCVGEIWRNLAWEGKVLGSRVPRSSPYLS